MDLAQYPPSYSYPCKLGSNLSESDCVRMLLLLAAAYMIDMHSSHCTPVPESLFSWSIDVP